MIFHLLAFDWPDVDEVYDFPSGPRAHQAENAARHVPRRAPAVAGLRTASAPRDARHPLPEKGWVSTEVTFGRGDLSVCLSPWGLYWGPCIAYYFKLEGRPPGVSSRPPCTAQSEQPLPSAPARPFSYLDIFRTQGSRVDCEETDLEIVFETSRDLILI